MIYADYNGSAPPLPEVCDHVKERLTNGPHANPNAIHSLGQDLLRGINKCRRTCAEVLGSKSNQIIFNSGASEGISHVFHSLLSPQKNKTIILSKIEHSAVNSSAQYYEKLGHTLAYVDNDDQGIPDLNHLETLLERNDVAIVSIMAANNETGVILPYEKIATICKKHQAPYFSDTTQLIGKMPFNFESSGIDFAVMSGHKTGALLGTGLVLAKDPTQLLPHVFGGGQEKNLRGGTQNALGIESLALALKIFHQNIDHLETARKARDLFEKNLLDKFPKIKIFGKESLRVPTTSFFAYPGILGQGIQIELESEDIFITTSSACSDNEANTSKVLRAMNVTDEFGRGAIRVSLCCKSAQEQYPIILKSLISIIEKLSKIDAYS